MKRHGKKYTAARSRVPAKMSTLEEAIPLLKQIKTAKFDETMEVALLLGVDPEHADQMDSGDLMSAWGGVAGLQLALTIVWTEAHARGHGLEQIAKWMSELPARFAGLKQSKGRIAFGRDADLVIFDNAATQTVTPSSLHHRHKVTPFLGETLRGVVHATYLRGTRVAEGGKALAIDRGELL